MHALMHALTAVDILRIWEAGRGAPPVQRALTILGAAWPEQSTSELAGLPIGTRDARLIALRQSLFGTRLDGFVECPRCTARLELPLDTTQLLAPSAAPASSEWELVHDGYALRFRLPDSRDLYAAARAGRARGQLVLLSRCILSARHDATVLSVIDLPDSIIEVLSQKMAELDPQAEILLSVRCPDCEHAWDAHFDIVTHLWAELAAHARDIFRAVDVLARAYGWREADILAMSSQRRQIYLDMVPT